MFDVITKKEYFQWLREDMANIKDYSLKGIQDGYILSRLKESCELKIAEIGGGCSRVLNTLKIKNECWNIDKFEGLGNGPTLDKEDPDIRICREYLGEFSKAIPDDYFDVVFSISVVEHVTNLNNFFKDTYRILKPGGMVLHAIDTYVFDEVHPYNNKLDSYIKAFEAAGFMWLEKPFINRNLTFCARFASNSDIALHYYNKMIPSFQHVREEAQNISIKMEGQKQW